MRDDHLVDKEVEQVILKGSQSNNQYALPGDDEEEKEDEYSEQEIEMEAEMEGQENQDQIVNITSKADVEQIQQE